MKVQHSMVLAYEDNEGDVMVLYASPDANVYVDGNEITSNAPVEVYASLTREDFYALKREVEVRRNGDKRQGLIGG